MAVLTLALFILATPVYSLVSDKDIGAFQNKLTGLSIGDRIAGWAEKFIGTPYDTDPMGEYVTRKVIVADDHVDCMYHVFRSVELALSSTPEEALTVALDMRFHTKGILEKELVTNYDERFEYGIDMLESGKWGRNITGDLADTINIPGSRGIDHVAVIPKENIGDAEKRLSNGDIVFFVKDPSKRIVGEIVGHMGIIKKEGDDVYLIHASGTKKSGGSVKKVPLKEYASSMPFIGIIVSRF